MSIGPITLVDALEIIDAAALRAGDRDGVDLQTREALRLLWRFRKDAEFRETIQSFLDSLNGETDIGRSCSASASRDKIRSLLALPSKG